MKKLSHKVFIFLIMFIGLFLIECQGIKLAFGLTYKPIYNDEIIENRLVEKSINRFLNRERSFLQRGFDNMPYYIDLVEKIFENYELPHDLVYLPLIESAYSPRAFSRTGAAGIWQFMPGTGREYGLKINFWVDERRDPEKSTIAAARHLRDLYRVYNDWGLVLAAYNAGMGSVRRAVRKSKSRDIWRIITRRYLKRETLEYIPRFFAAVEIARNYDRYGFNINKKSSKNKNYKYTKKIKLEYPVDLTILAKKLGLSLKSIMFFNPELKRYITPPKVNYNLRIPTDYYALVFSICHNIKPQELIDVREYMVHTGETLGEIANLFQTNQILICRLNGIKNPKRIYAGQKLLVPVNNKNKNIRFNYNFYEIPKKGFLTQEINYTIKNGDNLWIIARKFHTTVEDLLAVNGLTFNSVLYPGDSIKIWVDLPLTR